MSNRLSKNDKRLIIELSLAGHSRKEIAEKFDVSPQSISKHVLRFIDTLATDEQKKVLIKRPRGGRAGSFKAVLNTIAQTEREYELMLFAYKYGYQSGYTSKYNNIARNN